MIAAAARAEGSDRRRAAGWLVQARTHAEVEQARAVIKRIGDLSDNIVGVGPFGIGLDGVLAWVPFVGTAYSLGAGAMLLHQGWRARVATPRLALAGAMLLGRTAVGVVPIAGDILVDLLRGHRYAAKVLQRGVDRTLYVEGSNASARSDPRLAAEIASARRVVFLDD